MTLVVARYYGVPHVLSVSQSEIFLKLRCFTLSCCLSISCGLLLFLNSLLVWMRTMTRPRVKRAPDAQMSFISFHLILFSPSYTSHFNYLKYSFCFVPFILQIRVIFAHIIFYINLINLFSTVLK